MSARANRIYLTKSRFMAGLQCAKRLWQQAHDPIPYEEREASPFQATGIEIGRKAHVLFPGGVLVDANPWEHEAAVQQTRALMANPEVPAIFEAAFEHCGVRIRVDILERLDRGAWGIREVKLSTGLKEEYLDDLAIQVWVLHGAGLRVASIELVHVNGGYVRGTGDIEWDEFFSRLDVRAQARSRVRAVPSRIASQKAILRRGTAPKVAPGHHCHAPYQCEFWERCTASMPEDWVFNLPSLRQAKFADLHERGIVSIRDIPEDFALSNVQSRMRSALMTGEAWISDDLAEALALLGLPTFYLDFETIFPVVPIYPGTSPYQQVPFQWSLHYQDSSGTLTHREFLASGTGDPREEFAHSLIAAVGDHIHPIAVYSPFEKRILTDLLDSVSGQRKQIKRIQRRLVDLLQVVRRHVYHSEFGGSFSIKSVAPALAPQITYDDLELTEGSMASSAFERIASGQLLPGETESALRRALLDYCKRDTLALVEVHRALVKQAACPSQ